MARKQAQLLLAAIAERGFDEAALDGASRSEAAALIAEATLTDLIEFVGATALKDVTHPLDRIATGVRGCLWVLRRYPDVAAFLRRIAYPVFRPGSIAFVIVERDLVRATEMDLIPQFRLRTAMDFVAAPVFSMMGRLPSDDVSDGEIDELALRVLLALGVDEQKARAFTSHPFDRPEPSGDSLLKRGAVLSLVTL